MFCCGRVAAMVSCKIHKRLNVFFNFILDPNKETQQKGLCDFYSLKEKLCKTAVEAHLNGFLLDVMRC